MPRKDICPLVPYLPESKIYQGVTSELGGNCGISILPCNPQFNERVKGHPIRGAPFPCCIGVKNALNCFCKIKVLRRIFYYAERKETL